MKGMRAPTPDEIQEITAGLARSQHMSEGEVSSFLEGAAVGVVDHYITDGPGYTGKLVSIIWPAGPDVHEVLYFHDGQWTSTAEAATPIKLTLDELHKEDEEITKLFDDLAPPKEGDEWKEPGK
jgi:hypothetical protein